MSPPLEFLLEGSLFAFYFYNPGGSYDPYEFWKTLSPKLQASFLATFQGFADTGKVPGNASGHPQGWYHCQPPRDAPPLTLFKFKDDPKLRFYSIVLIDKKQVILTFGFQDPKQGRERDRRSPTGIATKRAEEKTILLIKQLDPQ